MWEIVLYLSLSTIAGFVVFCAALPWVLTALEVRFPRFASNLLRALLIFSLIIILVATIAPTQAIDSGGSRYVSWIPGEGLWGDGLQALGMGNMEREMILRLQVANALMFIPLGIFFSLMFRWGTLGKAALACAALSAFIESVQYAMNAGRIVDVDDVLFNSLGGLIGATLALAPRLIFTHKPIASATTYR